MFYTLHLHYLAYATTISNFSQYFLIYSTSVLFIGTIIYLSSEMDLRNILNVQDASPGITREEDRNNVVRKFTFQLTTTPWFTTNTRPNIYDRSWGTNTITQLDHSKMVAKLIPMNKGYYTDNNRTHGNVIKHGRCDFILRSSTKVIADMVRP